MDPKGKLSKTEEVQILHITKSVITEKQESFFTEKHFTSQEVFHIKILHFMTSIFYKNNLMLQISFFTKKLHNQSNMTAKQSS